MKNERELIRRDEVLRLAHVSDRHWQRMVTSGIAPAGVRVSPRVILWWRDEVLEFLESRERTNSKTEPAGVA